MITQEDKIYFNIHTALYHHERQTEDDIVYIRDDDFIDKACDWLRKELVNFEDYIGMGEELIKDFKKHMKGE